MPPTQTDEGAQHGRVHHRNPAAHTNTESDLSRARETGDDFLAEVEQAELDDLHRLAAEHGVDVGVARV